MSHEVSQWNEISSMSLSVLLDNETLLGVDISDESLDFRQRNIFMTLYIYIGSHRIDSFKLKMVVFNFQICIYSLFHEMIFTSVATLIPYNILPK